METIRFGLIGLGLMGREFASAAARWTHLPDLEVRPEIVALCSRNLNSLEWFRNTCPAVKQVTRDYREMLANPEVDAIYCAVPHDQHRRMYCETVEAGKHLFGEKPFGIDMKTNREINRVIEKHPDVLVRCSSQFPFTPAAQYLCAMIEEGRLGEIIEVEAGFLHSSDLNPEKPINWKRSIATNGEYGCMGDLGMHVCHIPFRAGWVPLDVRAILSNIIPTRPDSQGKQVPCETWDNATLLCRTRDDVTGSTFPMTLKMQRIAPGESNTWYLTVLGTRSSVRISTRNINVVHVLEYDGRKQNWETIDIGHAPAFKSITGAIFEFGFSDAILQMWGAYLYELQQGKPLSRFAGCVTPAEVAASHRLFTAALQSQKDATTVGIPPQQD
ncbi:MAG: gfo/Idh/MocA family oxidoreductase [Spirochaetaceae bacterium]|nr:MAG: gfo/Idh/MocA family oxidoreductase [Spirochaetaceae bacterium]